jgi:hypothetical protein
MYIINHSCFHINKLFWKKNDSFVSINHFLALLITGLQEIHGMLLAKIHHVRCQFGKNTPILKKIHPTILKLLASQFQNKDISLKSGSKHALKHLRATE